MKTLVEVKGRPFVSIKEAANHYGLTYKTVHMRLIKGWTIAQALDVDPPSGRISYNHWLWRKGIKEKVCSLCNKQKPLIDFFMIYKETINLSPFFDNHHSACKKCMSKAVGWSNIKKKFGLSKKEWFELLKKQDNKCAICKSNCFDKKWNTDHNHISGKVRGILCNNCNIMLGMANDNINILSSAIKYLTKRQYNG